MKTNQVSINTFITTSINKFQNFYQHFCFPTTFLGNGKDIEHKINLYHFKAPINQLPLHINEMGRLI